MGTDINQNNATFSVPDGSQVLFTQQTDSENSKIIHFGAAHAGDVFIIAAHPNTRVPDKYIFKSDKKTLVRPNQNGQEDLTENLQTPLLTIWRTLWIERKRMDEPEIGTSDNKFNPNEQYIEGAQGDRGNISKNKWMAGTYSTMPPSEPKPFFDVKFQPLLPELNFVIDELKNACIKVQEITDNMIFDWTGNEASNPVFTKNLSYNNTSNSLIGRDINSNKANFWNLHVLGAYKPQIADDLDHYSVNEGLDRFQPGYAKTKTAYIYFEVLRNMFSNLMIFDSIDSNGNKVNERKPAWTGIDEAHKRLGLHELLHYFLGTHKIPASPTADYGIMDTNLFSSSHYLCTGGTSKLFLTQILSIQAVPFPNKVTS